MPLKGYGIEAFYASPSATGVELPFKSVVEMDDITEELEDLEVMNFERKSFVPYDSLRQLLVESRVKRIVRVLSDEDKIQFYQQSDIIARVLDNGLRLFAILLSLSRPETVLNFLETDHFAHIQLDSRLPISRHTLETVLQDEKLRNRVFNRQWKFLAPFLRADQTHRELHSFTILPFVECEHVGGGGFGEVHKMVLHASQQGLNSAALGKVKYTLHPGLRH